MDFQRKSYHPDFSFAHKKGLFFVSGAAYYTFLSLLFYSFTHDYLETFGNVPRKYTGRNDYIKLRIHGKWNLISGVSNY